MLIIVYKNFSQGEVANTVPVHPSLNREVANVVPVHPSLNREVANVVPVHPSSNKAPLSERNRMFDAQQQISYGGNEKKVFFSVTAT